MTRTSKTSAAQRSPAAPAGFTVVEASAPPTTPPPGTPAAPVLRIEPTTEQLLLQLMDAPLDSAPTRRPATSEAQPSDGLLLHAVGGLLRLGTPFDDVDTVLAWAARLALRAVPCDGRACPCELLITCLHLALTVLVDGHDMHAFAAAFGLPAALLVRSVRRVLRMLDWRVQPVATVLECGVTPPQHCEH